MSHPTQPPVSVVIASYRDAPLLKICLERLAGQTYDPALVETVVVDNYGDEDVRRVCAEHGAIYLTEKTPGCAAARNTGIQAARHEILAFTDTDVLPAADWLEAGVRRLLSSPGCGFVAGPVRIFTQGKPGPTLAETFDQLTGFPVRTYVEKQGYGVQANLFTTKSVVAKAGLLNPNLAGAEDWEWGRRVCAAGFHAIYDEAVVVAHPARMTIAQLVHKTRRQTLGFYQWNHTPGSRIRFALYHLACLGALRRRWPDAMRELPAPRRSALRGLSVYLNWVAGAEALRIMLTGGTGYRR